jgi:ubiquinone/menaquinone biosynthesis C-methylase UbiE
VSGGDTLLHRDDGLAGTQVPGEKLADLEVRVSDQFLKAPGRLLDLGCGKGRASFYFATKGYDTIGVDIDLETIRVAKRLAPELGVHNCEFMVADMRSLCFRDSVFDYAISFGSSLSEKFRMWLDRRDRKSAVQEASRVTSVEGTIVFDFVNRY